MKIPKKRFFAYLFLIYLILALPLVYAIIVGPRHVYVSITISNQPPLITNVSIGVGGNQNSDGVTNGVTPIENGTVIIQVIVNVTDVDGTGNINANTMKANVSRNGVVRANSSFNCNLVAASNASSAIYNCSILMFYYDNASTAWQINVTVADNANATSILNFSSMPLIWNTLSAMQVMRNAITFGSASLGAQNVEASVIVNNTGNDPFNAINITAYDLNNSDSTEFFRIFGNFSVNATQNSGATGGRGRALINRTQVNVPIEGINASLPITNPDGTSGFQAIYFYVDVPLSGLSTSTIYNSTPPGWAINVTN